MIWTQTRCRLLRCRYEDMCPITCELARLDTVNAKRRKVGSDNGGAKMTGKFITGRAFFALLALLTCLSFGAGVASAQEVGSYAHVQADALNLRTAPDTRSSVLRALPYGTSVSILDRRDGWARVFVQGADGHAADGWVAARFLGQGARTGTERKRPIFRGHHRTRPEHQNQTHRPGAPLRVSKLDFDCRPALFGNSGIRKCVASVRVRLSQQEFDPNRSDHVFIACRGAISYRTDKGHGSQRLLAFERHSIAHNDRLGQSVHVNFPVQSERDKIVSAHLVSFSCVRD